jgi:hypothetical protein
MVGGSCFEYQVSPIHVVKNKKPILFEFFWAPLPHAVPPLIADHGMLLPQLLDILSLEEM